MKRKLLTISILTVLFVGSMWGQHNTGQQVVKLVSQMQSLTERANDAYKRGNYIDAAKYSGESLYILGRNFGKETEEYVNSSIIHASYAVLAGEKDRAIETGYEALRIQKKLPNSDKIKEAQIQSILSEIFIEAEEYQIAIKLAQDVYRTYVSYYGTNSVNVITPLRNIARANFHLKKYPEAVRIQESILSIANSQDLPNNELVMCYLNLIDSYIANKETTDASNAMDKVLELSKEIESVSLQFDVSSRIPSLLYAQNKREAVIKADENLVNQCINIYGMNSRKTLASVESLLYDSYKLKQIPNVKQYVSLYIDLVKQQIVDNIMTASLSRQASFWETYAFTLSTFIPFLTYKSKDNSFNGDAYNALLISKTFMLNTEARIRNSINKNGNKLLQQVYNDMLQGINDLNSIRDIPIKERTIDEISIKKYIEQKQSVLYAEAETDFHFHNWTDIQMKLKNNEAAIELAIVQDYDLPNRFDYIAYVIKPGIKFPIQIYLFDLISWYDNCNPEIPDSRMYNLVWKPLEQVLKGVNKLYISPAGKLWESPFEHSLLANSNNPLNKLEVYRVSSTTELLKEHSPSTGMFALFGGMKYQLTNKESITAVQRSKKRGSLDDISYTTMHEVNEISRILHQDKLPVIIFIGENANEEEFKGLCSKSLKAIHIATHGFSWGNTSCNTKSNEQDHRDEIFGENFDVLYQCGLLFSGAKNTLDNKKMPFIENGILTASEISALDLRQTDLVVLSACQTGLGKTNVEGVWGLSRAFKRSGVNSILTTLWSVDDDATLIFMVEFYRNWLRGNNKVNSLKLAQKYLRDYEVDGENIYSDPKYWACFTLLDAIY